MTCREFAEFMADYLSGELPAETQTEFERHLSICPNCRVYLDGYKTTVKLGRTAFADPAAELPPAVPEELVRAILAARPRTG